MAENTSEDVYSDSDEYHSADEDIEETRKVKNNLQLTNTTSDSMKTDISVKALDCGNSTEPVSESVDLPEDTNTCQTTMASNVNISEPVIGETTSVDSVKHCDNNQETEFVTNLDNRYVSEGVDIKDEKIELTEEQKKEMREQADKLKTSGNEAFKDSDYEKAVELYSEALTVYPTESTNEISICYANRGACFIKLERNENVVDDCTKALELRPDYLKPLMRRAQSYEALEKLEQALEDYKKALQLDPSQTAAREAVMRLPEQIKEQHEKMKEEMIGKLKELGDAVLKPFGLSTSNFQLQQDPNTGGYSVNFRK